MIALTAPTLQDSDSGIEVTPGADMLYDLANPADATFRYLVTLKHVKTDDEKLVDLLTDHESFSHIRTVIRSRYASSWAIQEILPLWEDDFKLPALRPGEDWNKPTSTLPAVPTDAPVEGAWILAKKTGVR